MSHSVCVALVQLPNNTQQDVNVAAMAATLTALRKHHVDLVVFPEAMLTGFSAKLEPCELEQLRPAWERLRSHAGRGALVLPSILHVDDTFINTGWILEGETMRSFTKVGLTESEKLFFQAPEDPGTRTFSHKGVRFGLVICREIADAPEAYFTRDEVDLILWPGYWNWSDDDVWGPEPGPQGDLGAHAFHYVNALQRPLLQANFCYNHLDHAQSKKGPNGRSRVISQDNQQVHQGPDGEPSAILVTCTKERDVWSISSCEDVSLSHVVPTP